MLTDAQLQVLSTDLFGETDSEFVAARTAGNNGFMRDWYNANASPNFHVFRSSLSSMETRSNLDYPEILGGGNPITDLERWGFDTLTTDDSWNPSLPGNRQAIEEVFSGPQRATTRGNLQAAYVRLATRAEKLFAVNGVAPNGGNGDTATTAANLVFEGQVTIDEIRAAVAIGG